MRHGSKSRVFHCGLLNSMMKGISWACDGTVIRDL
jgi:hypothetical protein